MRESFISRSLVNLTVLNLHKLNVVMTVHLIDQSRNNLINSSSIGHNHHLMEEDLAIMDQGPVARDRVDQVARPHNNRVTLHFRKSPYKQHGWFFVPSY